MNAAAPCSGESTKVFPLRLCEVLEKEFVTIRGRMSHAPGWLLAEGDIRHEELLSHLCAPVRDPSRSPLSAIRERIEQGGFRVCAAEPLDAAGKALLLERLNAALQASADLYDITLLDPETPARQLAELRREALKSQRTRGEPTAPSSDDAETAPSENATDEQIQLNRLLLEAAIPASAIARVDHARLDQLFEEIHALRGPNGMYSALCLSGGGIRSAAFALGVVQGLARRGLLEKFDYLSTVSGGGYVGSWLSTWIHRHPRGLSGVVEEMNSPCPGDAGNFAPKIEPESEPVRFLRSYSHFLNPRAGLFSVDTWTWIGIYLRNLSLNWLLLIPFLMLLLAAPRLYAALLLGAAHGDSFAILVGIATLAAILAVLCPTLNRPSLSDPATGGEGSGAPTPGRFVALRNQLKRQHWVLMLGVAPLMAFSVLITLLVWGLPPGKISFTLQQVVVLLANMPRANVQDVQNLLGQLAAIGFDYLVVWGILIVFAAWLVSVAIVPRPDWKKRWGELGVMVIASLVAWLLIDSIAGYAGNIGVATRAAVALWPSSAHPVAFYPAHLYTVLAVPTIAAAVLAGMTIFIGGVSKCKWIEDEDREWWGRFGAWVLVCIVAWSALSAIAILGPSLLLEFPRLIAAVGGTAGLTAVLFGKSSLTAAAAGKSAASGSKGRKIVLDFLGLNSLALVSVVFLAVFFAFLSLLGSALLKALFDELAPAIGATDWKGWLAGALELPAQGFSRACGHDAAWPWADFAKAGVFSDPQVHLTIACQTPPFAVGLALAVLGLLVVLASWAINLNKFSLHAAYRIRIIRTFLGASRHERNPNPFTGFDPLDNVQMHELQPGLLREGDFKNLDALVARLHDGMLGKRDSAEKELVRILFAPQQDRGGILQSRLRSHKPGTPVLKSLQRDLLESLNRLLETERLDRIDAFRKLAKAKDGDISCSAAAKGYLARGNLIFANRLFIDSAFPEEISAFDFPPPPPHKLMHVVNLTLNLVRGGKLAWQERKAAPFAVTPMHAGSYYLGFRESRDYGGKDGISLGTATAISGAAVSPSMGYTSSPITALLLTLFNVRLGWWLGNPGVAGSATYPMAEPVSPLRPLLSEALGLTDDQSPYVYLSDGGHFENMGVFEMVLRRCRLIVASDAGADPDYQFEDLGNAVRKIRIDLGIPIEFGEMPIRRGSAADDRSGRYCAIGRIRYSCVDGEGAPDGVLVCFKPVLRGDEPRDVLHYAVRNEPFPQESTGDQFFGESQFESYRQLGQFALETAFGDGSVGAAGKWWFVDFVERIRAHVATQGAGEDWLDPWLRNAAPKDR